MKISEILQKLNLAPAAQKDQADFIDIQGLADAINEQATALVEREQGIATREAALAKQEEALTGRETALSARENALNDRETALNEREQNIEATIAERAAKISMQGTAPVAPEKPNFSQAIAAEIDPAKRFQLFRKAWNNPKS